MADYFDAAYFDAAYFDTAEATPINEGGPRYISFTRLPKPEPLDEDWIDLLL